MYMEIRIKSINSQHNILTFVEPGTLVNRIAFYNQVQFSSFDLVFRNLKFH